MAVPAEMAEKFTQLTEMVAQLMGVIAPQQQQIAQLLEAQVGNAQRTPGEQSACDLRKAFERVEKFDGKTEAWKEWHYQVSVIWHENCRKSGHVMDKVEKLEEDMNTEDLSIELKADEAEWMIKTKDLVFSRLIQMTTGEANGIVRSVEDRNGYVAWRKDERQEA